MPHCSLVGQWVSVVSIATYAMGLGGVKVVRDEVRMLRVE